MFATTKTPPAVAMGRDQQTWNARGFRSDSDHGMPSSHSFIGQVLCAVRCFFSGLESSQQPPLRAIHAVWSIHSFTPTVFQASSSLNISFYRSTGSNRTRSTQDNTLSLISKPPPSSIALKTFSNKSRRIDHTISSRIKSDLVCFVPTSIHLNTIYSKRGSRYRSDPTSISTLTSTSDLQGSGQGSTQT